MPIIFKQCFLYHYDSSTNSDKVFNLFLIDNENETYSTISEYGRSETKLNIKPLVENCSLALAQNRFTEKRWEKINHKRTPYLETFNCSYSPTLKQFGSFKAVQVPPAQQPAKVLEFNKSAKAQPLAPVVNKSGEQKVTNAEKGQRKRTVGALNLDQLDALEL